MFGLGMQELLIILVLVLILFGAGKLPQVGSSLGKGIKNFKKGLSGEDEKDDQNPEKPKDPFHK
ncbi:MAG: twin-arginine translocase TatA/TatE family subunit [Deltaproteobacteria bacterium]|nr:twin-arginine translocase TatA/TatE family subunit [Deltaproteobacteria bacterium]